MLKKVTAFLLQCFELWCPGFRLVVFNAGRPIPAERLFKHHFPNYIPAYFLFNNCNKKGNRPVVIILHDNDHYHVVTNYRGAVKGGFRHLHIH